MTETDKQLLAEYDYNIISVETFTKYFSVNLKSNLPFIRNEMKIAIASSDPEEIGMMLSLVWLSGDVSKFTDILNDLLINPNHTVHQAIARALQDIASPTTIPYVRKALQSNFDYLEYTCSDSDAIAKWFSWILFSIGTPEAINLMKEFSNSSDEGIRNEMLYRLKKVQV